MRITSIRLTNFRNYAALALVPGHGLNVLVGENAAGKTNVLESVFLSALGRSHRTVRDAELILHAEDAANVRLALETRAGGREIEVRLSRAEKKRILLDGAQLTRSGELMGALNAVLFSPEDMSLVKGGPAERRRFLDMELSQQRPSYYYALQRYNQALRQRNALLRDPGAPRETVPLWDEQLATAGGEIMRARAAFCDTLSGVASGLHAELSGGKEQLAVSYAPNVATNDPEAASRALFARLAESLPRDLLRGGTGAGPHRDDLLITIDGKDARLYGSQGQQRTAVLSLKLSELAILKRVTGEDPVLLLDDVFSELDPLRQRMLLYAAGDAQTFITCTHLDALTDAGIKDMRVFAVRAGGISPAGA